MDCSLGDDGRRFAGFHSRLGADYRLARYHDRATRKFSDRHVGIAELYLFRIETHVSVGTGKSGNGDFQP